jgi:hypothetical protein
MSGNEMEGRGFCFHERNRNAVTPRRSASMTCAIPARVCCSLWECRPSWSRTPLGHSSYQLTMDSYSHMIPTLRNEVADRVDEIFPTAVKKACQSLEHSSELTHILLILWCREGGSNPHDRKDRRILSPLRLPVPPSRRTSLSVPQSLVATEALRFARQRALRRRRRPRARPA